MLNLEGQIVSLKQNGKQVAGLYDWESHIILTFTTKDGMKDYKPIKRLSARSYWLVEPVEDDVFEAEFYQIFMEELILIDKGEVSIDLPDKYTIDRRQYVPVDIRWIRDFEH